MTSNSSLLKRREFLSLCTSLTLGTAAGCGNRPKESTTAIAPRSDIPLNVAVAFDGGNRDTEDRVQSIQRAWSAVSEHPLAITPIAYNRTGSADFAARLLAQAKKSDVLIFPIALGSELVSADAITPLSDSFCETVDREHGTLLPGLRNGMSIFADQTIGLPLGTSLPALLSIDSIGSIESWEDYDGLVANEWKGRAAEPTAPGWAAAMFLWRAVAIKEWLFDRETLSPLIDTDPYIDRLEQMITTHDRYQEKRQRPDQIWSLLVSGSLGGGISWKHNRQADVEVNVADLPEQSKPPSVLFDAFATITSLSANCRQTETAKRFIAWIAGDKSSQSMRNEVFTAATNRILPANQATPDSFSDRPSNYDRWLVNRLASPITRPTLQLKNSLQYYTALDREIGRALEHEASAKDALVQTAKTWQEITDEVGEKKQLRIWNRLQGLSG